MTTLEFLSHLRSLNVELSVDGEYLRCNGPKAVLTPELQAELRDHKEGILAYLRAASGTAPPLQPAPRSSDLPLSFAQQRLWFLDQLEPESSFYNISPSLRLEGVLNVEALRKSLSRILDRHEVLRTTIALVDGNPTQVVGESKPCPLTIVDLGEGPDSRRQEAMHRILDSEAKRPFNLSQDLMVRATLLRLGPTEHVLLLVTHHIASDGWSSGILWQELASLYTAFLRGEPDPLPELPIQYADYAVWQRQWLQGKVLETQISYWKGRLQDVAVLQLPTDRPRPAVQSYRGATESSVLTKAFSDQLELLSRQQGVTLFMMLLAAFQTLLHRYSGQEDIVVGTPIAGRTRSETEGLIGFFVNTLVLRNDLSDNPTFRELLTRVRKVALEAYEHQDLPFEKLVEELHPDRDLSRSPLFQVMFAHQNVPRQTFELPGLTVSRVETQNDTAKFDLSLNTRDETGGLKASLEYNTDLFDAATIKRMLGHFEVLLEGIVANPDQRLSELPILTEAERHLLLVEWNGTKTDYPNDKCIHELFEAQVERTPDAIALVFEDKQLSYRELNSKANQLAHYLRKLGVGPEVLVGIYVQRSLEMVIGLLGILKAGGAHVPFDPAYSNERLAFMLKDAHVPVLLTQERLVAGLAEHDAKVICLDSDWETMARERGENLGSSVLPENLAYVIYTSGSTGQPKGVLVSHGSIADHCLNAQEYYELDSRDVVLQFASLSFDVSLEEILPTLIVGARLVIAEPEVWHPAEIHRKISEFGLTVLNLPTAYWQELAREWANVPELVPSIHPRLFIVGGDTMLPDALKSWKRTPVSSIRLLNAYGPTETTITATAFEIASRPGENTMDLRVPIGRPLTNRAIYLLDQHNHPVPIGVHGHLHIGGDGLARGYLNRPELTAEKFIPNPFSNEPGARLYKTGDLARYLPDGNIEHLGRIDYQVKIRGFRIELGEIEAVLCQYPAVQEVVVAVREEVPGEKRLVGYVVPSQGSAPTISELRSFLQAKEPDYMVPSAFVMLEALPLMPNGKIDRRALPVPDQRYLELERNFVAPGTPIEEALAQIWSKVLSVEQVGIHNNFFDLGGHSLLATRVISLVRQTFHLDLPLRALFEAPTVAGLAERIETAFRSGQGLEAPPIVPVSRDDNLFLSFAQQRLWFLDQLLPGSVAYNISEAVRLTGPLNEVALEQSLTEILRRHEILRTTFGAIDGKPFQTISPAMPFILPVTDLQHLPETEREAEARRQATAEARQPFDLAKGPLFRAILWRLGEEDHVFLYNMHHIVSDGWSMGVFFRELTALYEAFSIGKPSPLAEVSIQYVDFSVWQRQWLQGRVLETQLSYWKEQLHSAPVLQLPTDRPRPAVQSYRGARQAAVFSKTLSDQMQVLSRQQGVTLFMTLLAAFQTLLHRYSGQEDIVVGTPIAGRARSETEGLIGFFVNTLVLRNDLSANPTFRELLTRVRKVALEAYEHQDLPFEKLVEELHPDRDLSRSPLFQVMFAHQNVPRQTFELPGLTVNPVETLNDTAKFDLSLFTRDETGGLKASLEYNTDLFDAATVERMLGHFEVLLEGIAANPDQRLSELPILTEAERHQLLVEWNDTKTDYPNDKCIHELFEAQVDRSPNAVAVVIENKELTYRELNRRANQLAHYLQKKGVGPDVQVGICMERSLEMVVALLGILKAGGAYTPLDPTYPSERLTFMLEDTHVSVLLTEEGFQKKLIGHNAEVICIDLEWEQIAQESKQSPPSNNSPNSLAYVMYTSGSSGQPKGVQVCHRGVVRLLFGVDYVELDSEKSILQMAPISFDASTFELWGSLLHGGRCVLYPDRAPTVATLGMALRKQSISTLWLTASLYNMVIDEAPEILSGVRQLLIGGEALSLSHVRQGLKLLQSTQIINGYGPTENTTFTCCYPIPRWLGEAARSVPIGRPIGNTKVYLLDRNLQLVPTGVSGELFIGGAGLARGYLNRPEQTTEKFIPNPFSDEPGARLYKTGDVARYLPDGNIEFLGRIDHQVKIRGFRIELGEIEAVLCQHPTVREVVVVAREDVPGEKRLVAYVVPSQEQAPTIGELRSFLKSKQPEYMVPSAFVMLEALPMTPNGKIDRQALPLPDGSRDLISTFTEPRNDVERHLVRIWQEVLMVDHVSTRDNFFELGGHSLLAARMFAQLEKYLKIRVPLAMLFQTPTIEGLAAAIGEGRVSESWRSLVPIQPAGSRPPLFAVPGVGGNVLGLYNLARLLGTEQPFYGLQSRGLSGTETPLTSIEEIAAAFLGEIREVQREGPYYLVGGCMGGVVAYEMAQQLRAAGQEVGLLALVETWLPVRTSERHPRHSVRMFAALHLIVSRLRLYIQTLARLRGRQRFEYLLERLKMLTQMATQRDLFRGDRSEFYMQVVTETNLAAFQRYQPRVYPGHVVLIRAENRKLTSDKDPRLAWSRLAAGGLEIYYVPGNDSGLTIIEQNVPHLARQLEACLGRAQALASTQLR